MNMQRQMQQKPTTRQFAPVRSGLLQRKCACGGTPGVDGECAACRQKRLQRQGAQPTTTSTVPPIVQEALRSPGQPLDLATRARLEPRLGHDFSKVRIHTDAKAARSADAIGAVGYTVGQNIVFAAEQYAPHTTAGQHLLAHELVHTIQQGVEQEQPVQEVAPAHDPYEQAAESAATALVSESAYPALPIQPAAAVIGKVQPYRSKQAFNFGKDDTAALKEQDFGDAKTQPWIEQINLHFNATKVDSNGQVMPTGKLAASYFSNPAALSTLTFSISGGTDVLGLTDQGTKFKVRRIEGIGYNDLPIPAPDGEGPNRKYSKSLTASMHYAVFFNGGQAIHIGALDLGSHSCAHAGNDPTAFDKMRQLNYHSVIGKTKVAVTYDATALKEACCARMKHLGVKKKGGAPNPCQSEDPSTCP